MHWVCFHYVFEHGDVDVDLACKDPKCPSRIVDPDPPVDWLTEREVDPLVVELRDGLLMDHTVTL